MSKNSRLKSPYLTDDQEQEVLGLHNKERRVVSIGLILVIAFGVQDFLEDTRGLNDWLMVVTDLVYVSIMLFLLAYIWRHVPLARRRQSTLLAGELHKRHQAAQAWQARAAELMQGLSKMVNEQLMEWDLSKAEKEVAVMLLKGFSFKDIAQFRSPGERTVRQQAAHVYAKAGLAGRAELSAFFLEDLLPAEANKTR